uniref:NADPH--cytochrome P450 reductase n=1 Tax=Rhabditophanes sp. KR3021 TaxID=114890 RepID=A0AC35TIQ5_9BILA
MDYLTSLDTGDVIVLTLILGVVVYYLLPQFGINLFGGNETANTSNIVISNLNTNTGGSSKSKTFYDRMQSENRQVLILFGSQTGTAEELAGRMAKDLVRYGQKALVLDPEEIDPEDISKITQVQDPLLLLFMATYGEGDPTDNCQAFYEFFTNTDINLSGVKFAVFGLGNKTYEYFNEVGKVFDKKLEELGAERVFDLGLGDDDSNMEEDFMRWKEALLPKLGERFQWEVSADAALIREYKYEVIEDESVNVFTGEFGRVGAYNNQRAPYDQKNPLLCTVVVNKELHSAESDRSCKHIELSIEGSRMRYETGDHAAILPTNDETLVEALGELLEIDLSTVFKLTNKDVESTKKYPFPCPTTIRSALLHYVDICAPVKSHVLKVLAEYASDPKETEYLKLLSTANEEGLKEYGVFIQKDRRSIIHVLGKFRSCKPPIEFLLELLPRLQPRYYSISSSPKTNANIISITAVVTEYKIDDREIKGVCTNFLRHKDGQSKLPMFVRKSAMRLPHRSNVPVIMIGPGTGLAPFRGFLQERNAQKGLGKEIGNMHLYFGCRNKDVDYIYRGELEGYEKDGLLSKLNVAFSRMAGVEKTYCQHLVWRDREELWKEIDNGGYIYVCGDAKNMARDVHNTFLKIFEEVGKLSSEDALKLVKTLERQKRYQTDVWTSNVTDCIFDLFPKTIADLSSTHHFDQLHLSLAFSNWWTSDWGYQPQPEIPVGASFKVTFAKETIDVDSKWGDLVQALNGIFCGSWTNLHPTHTKTTSAFTREAILNDEAVCTENFSPFLKLLPCKGFAGLASLMNTDKFYESNFHSLSIQFDKLDGSLILGANMITPLKPTKLIRSYDLMEIFGKSTTPKACNLATSSNIYILDDKEMVTDPRPDHIIPYGDLKFLSFDALNPKFDQITVSYEPATFKAEDKLVNPPLILIQSSTSHIGEQSGSIITKIWNRDDQNYQIKFSHSLTWFIKAYLHSMTFTCDGNEIPFKFNQITQSQMRGKPLHFVLTAQIPKTSLCVVSMEYDLHFLKQHEYPPDAEKGRVLEGPTIELELDYNKYLNNATYFDVDELKEVFQKIRLVLYSPPISIQLPLPDFSMPYNVICLVSTVIAMLYGQIHTITTKIMTPACGSEDEAKPLVKISKSIFVFIKAKFTSIRTSKPSSEKKDN